MCNISSNSKYRFKSSSMFKRYMTDGGAIVRSHTRVCYDYHDENCNVKLLVIRTPPSRVKKTLLFFFPPPPRYLILFFMEEVK